MNEKSADRLLVTDITRQELEFALGFVGLSDYKIEPVAEPLEVGIATVQDLKEFAEQSGANPQLATRLWKRVGEYYPHLITEDGSMDFDRLAEVIKNAHKWFTGGKKTVAFAQSYIDSKISDPQDE